MLNREQRPRFPVKRLDERTRPQMSDEAPLEGADLRRQLETLREAIRARDDFIVIAAHELRNPMTPILGFTELALGIARKPDTACDPQLTALLERLQQAVQDYTGRATRLLDVSRIEAGNLQLEQKWIDLSNLLLAIAEKYRVAAAHQGCRLDSDIGAGVSAWLDPLAVEEAVENLLSNALKFGAPKPVLLRLRSDRHSAQIDVRDHGIGISSEQQRCIFGRFEQVVAHHRGNGFGVGLWVAGRLVSAMNGQITVSSVPQEGSTFTIELPLSANRSTDD